jgi:penicillin-binding protein 1A
MSGSGLPVDVWSRFMKPAHQGLAATELPGLSGGYIRGPMTPPATLPPSQPYYPPSYPAGQGAPVPPAPVAGYDRRSEPNTGGTAQLDGWLIDKLFGRR